MRHPLRWLLRFGRSDADRLSLIGDLEEERRARRAAGAGRVAVFGWETREIVAACLYAIRDARPGARLRLTADVCYALRRWRRRPGFAATASLTIALGIAAATSIFSVVDAVLLRPLPWHAPDSLVVVHGVYPERRTSPATAPTWDRWYVSYPAWDALRTSPAFVAVGAWRFWNAFGDDNAAVIPYRIVGVVPDVKRQDPTDEDRPVFYALVGHRVAQVRPGAPVSTFSDTGLAARRVADRRREFGVRLALGARPNDVRRLVLRDAAAIVAIGLTIGLPSAFAAAQLAESLLLGVSASSLRVFATAAVVLGFAAFTATLLPARHAGRVDPVAALRE